MKADFRYDDKISNFVFIGEAGCGKSEIALNLAYDLAKEFNQYYHDTRILQEPDENILRWRLCLIHTVADVLVKAMDVLGIELPERM